MADRQPTHAQLYRDAVWETDTLTTVELAVALAYADHCRNGSDTAWVSQRRLMQRCKLGSSATAVRARAALVAKGWLMPAAAATRHRQVTVYRLVIPDPNRFTHETGSLSEPVHSKPVHSRKKPIHLTPQTDSPSEPDRFTSELPPSGEDPQSDPPPASAAATLRAATSPATQPPPAARAILDSLKLPRGGLTRPGRLATPAPYEVDRDRYDPTKALALAEQTTEEDHDQTATP